MLKVHYRKRSQGQNNLCSILHIKEVGIYSVLVFACIYKKKQQTSIGNKQKTFSMAGDSMLNQNKTGN